MTQGEQQQVRDLLLPGIVAVERSLGLGDVASLEWETSLLLKIRDEGRAKDYPIATGIEVETGAYKDLFLPRVRDAFDDFYRATGWVGVRAYLEKRGPRHAPGVADEEVPA